MIPAQLQLSLSSLWCALLECWWLLSSAAFQKGCKKSYKPSSHADPVYDEVGTIKKMNADVMEMNTNIAYGSHIMEMNTNTAYGSHMMEMNTNTAYGLHI